MKKIPVGTNHYHVFYNVQPLPCLVLRGMAEICCGLHFACDSVRFFSRFSSQGLAFTQFLL